MNYLLSKTGGRLCLLSLHAVNKILTTGARKKTLRKKANLFRKTTVGAQGSMVGTESYTP